MNRILDHILDKIDIGVLAVDTDQNIVEWNNWLERYTGKLRDETLGRRLAEVYPRFGEKIYQDILARALYHGQGRFCSAALHRAFISPAEEDLAEVRQNMIVESICENNASFALIQIADVTGHYSRISKLKGLLKNMDAEIHNIRESELRNRHLALHDALTGLPNRLLLLDRLSWVVSNADRNKEMAAVAFFDLDGFKQVNDAYGHETGDRLLKAVAARLRECLRKTDTVARIGGDEFIIVLHNVKSRENVDHIAKKLLARFGEGFDLGCCEIRIGVSLGISIFPDHALLPAELIKNADTAMYSVKKGGKNNYCFYQKTMN